MNNQTEKPSREAVHLWETFDKRASRWQSDEGSLGEIISLEIRTLNQAWLDFFEQQNDQSHSRQSEQEDRKEGELCKIVTEAPAIFNNGEPESPTPPVSPEQNEDKARLVIRACEEIRRRFSVKYTHQGFVNGCRPIIESMLTAIDAARGKPATDK